MDLTLLRQDAFAKVSKKYQRALFTDAALVKISDFLNTLFRYPEDSCGWMMEVITLARTPLCYLSIPAHHGQPAVTRLWLGRAEYQQHAVHLYALPDWSPLLREKAYPKPPGAVAGIFHSTSVEERILARRASSLDPVRGVT